MTISMRMVAVGAGLVMILMGLAADAQDDKAPKGIKSRNLVTSLGGFSAVVNAPIAISGATIELEPGGQTGKQRFRVPAYIYILDGVLTTDYEAGPVGVAGVQYHAGGQSFVDPGGVWHNHKNTQAKAVKYLIVYIGYPGATPVQKPDPD
jgi:quercetin dioxygenase-like cupin family protein